MDNQRDAHGSVSGEGSVRIPTSEDEAALMVLLGTNWLEANAPHRLRHQSKPDTPSDTQRARELIRTALHEYEPDTSAAQPKLCADCGVPVGGVHSLLCVRRSQHGEHIVRSGNIREVNAAQQTRSEE